jgi:hypothetical protein
MSFTPEGGSPIPIDFEIPTPEATRRPGVEGYPVKLADGRTWDLARPRLYFRPRFTPVEGSDKPSCELEERWDYPHPARRHVKLMLDHYNHSESFPLAVVIEPALELVMLAHDITAEQAVELFDLDRDQVEDLGVAMLRMFRGDQPAATTEEPEKPSTEG